VLDRLRNNLGLKLLSIAIAIAAWAYLRLTPNPVIAARFVQQVDVPIATTGLPPEEVARFSDRQAVVAVDVGRGGSIRADMVRAVLSLDGRGPGVYNVPVQVIAPKLEIRSLSPASVTLEIERVERRSVPVAVEYVGDPRRVVVSGKPSIDPAFATISGPTSDLARVTSVRVDVPLPGTAATFDEMVRPSVADDRGNELTGIAVSPNLIRVHVRFTPPVRNGRRTKDANSQKR
jgi:hypothetical protein